MGLFNQDQKKGRGLVSPYLGKRVYTKMMENPYRKGSALAVNYDLIKDGMSFEEYKKAGGEPSKLTAGIVSGYIAAR